MKTTICPFESCIRCGRPIRSERPACVVNGQAYPYAGCRPDTADTRLRLIKVGSGWGDATVLPLTREADPPVPSPKLLASEWT